MLDGVKDGLINPTVVDVETGLSADIMSKEGLTFKGVNAEVKMQTSKILQKDFKKNLNQRNKLIIL